MILEIRNHGTVCSLKFKNGEHLRKLEGPLKIVKLHIYLKSDITLFSTHLLCDRRGNLFFNVGCVDLRKNSYFRIIWLYMPGRKFPKSVSFMNNVSIQLISLPLNKEGQTGHTPIRKMRASLTFCWNPTRPRSGIILDYTRRHHLD